MLGTSPSAPAFLNITFKLNDVDEKPELLWGSVDEKPFVLLFDENDYAQTSWNGSEYHFLVVDQDSVDSGNFLMEIIGEIPRDGSVDALTGGGTYRASDFFAFASLNSTWNIGRGAWETKYVLRQTTAPLSSLLPKLLRLRIRAIEARALNMSSEPLALEVQLVRTNNPVNFTSLARVPLNSFTLPQNFSTVGLTPTLPLYLLNITENSPPNTYVGPLIASDFDYNQRLSYQVIWSDESLSSTFRLDADVSNDVSRFAKVFVNRDSLDYDVGQRSYHYLIKVEDDAAFNSTLLRKQPKSWDYAVLRINVIDEPFDVPVITAVTPQLLDVGGNEPLIIEGAYLGLLDGPGAVVEANYTNNRFVHRLTDCKVLTRHTKIRCITDVGYGSEYGIQYKVSGMYATSGSNISLSYRVPTIDSVQSGGSGTNISTGGAIIPTEGGTFSILGVQFPLAQNSTSPGTGRRLQFHTSDGISGFISDASSPWPSTGFPARRLSGGADPAFRVTFGSFPNVYEAVNCSIIGGGNALQCQAPPGAGARLLINVDVEGQTSSVPMISYGAPVVADVELVGNGSCAGNDLVIIRGFNFATSAFVQQLEVEYAATPLVFDNRCDGFVHATCAIQRADHCNVTVDHREIHCFTIPGFGRGFHWRVKVAGQISAWSQATTDYIDPFIREAAPFYSPTETVPRSPGYEFGLSTLGGTRFVLKGQGFYFGSQTKVWVGHVQIAMKDMTFSSDTESMVVVSPPGFGRVPIQVMVGNTSAFSSIPYAIANVTQKPEWDSGEASSEWKSVVVSGQEFSLCAICNSDPQPQICTNITYTRLEECARPDAIMNGTLFRASVNGSVAQILRASETEVILRFQPLGNDITFWQGEDYYFTMPFNFVTTLDTRPLILTAKPESPSNKMSTGGWTKVRLRVANAGYYGQILVHLAPGVNLTCPILWNTTIIPLDRRGAMLLPLPGDTKGIDYIKGKFYAPPIGTETQVRVYDLAYASELQEAKAAIQANADRWKYVVFTDEGWYVFERLSCFSDIWKGSTVGSENQEVVFVSPPWVQKVNLTLQSGTRVSMEPFSENVLYEDPVVVEGNYPSACPSTGRGEACRLWLNGKEMAIAPSLGATFGLIQPIFSSFYDSVSSFIVPDRVRPPEPPSWMDKNYGVHRIRFYYKGMMAIEKPWMPRYCEPDWEWWKTTLIRCIAPEGVGGSENHVVLIINTTHSASPMLLNVTDTFGTRSAEIRSEANNLFKYAMPELFNISTSDTVADTRGNFPAILRGKNLSRFRLATRPPPSVMPSAMPSSDPSPSPSATSAKTPTTTRTVSPSATISASASRSRSLSMSSMPTPSSTVSATMSASLSSSVSLSASTTASGSPSPSLSASRSEMPTVTVSASITASLSVTSTVSASLSASPSISPSIFGTPSAFETPTASASLSSSISASTMAMVSVTPSPVATEISVTASATVSPSETASSSVTASASTSSSPSPSGLGRRRDLQTTSSPEDDPEYDIFNDIASADGNWRMEIIIEDTVQPAYMYASGDYPTAGMVEKDYRAPVSAHKHDFINFTMPSFEGAVNISVRFIPVIGNVIISNPVTFAAPAPFITSIAAEYPPQGYQDEDPCAALHDTRFNVTEAKTCTEMARLTDNTFGGLPGGMFPVDPLRPCFRAPLDANGRGVIFKITGHNFGSTRSPQSIVVGDEKCGPVPGQSILVDAKTLRCQLGGALNRTDNLDVSVSTAFRSIRSSQYKIFPRAVCPCGKFSEVDGAECVKCPDGATCAGVVDKPRPLNDYWETFPSEWLEERDIDPTGLPRFLPCAVKGLCLSNQTCPEGSGGWMCVKCLKGFSRGYDGICAICDPKMNAKVYVVMTVVILLLILFIYLFRLSSKRGFGAKNVKELVNSTAKRIRHRTDSVRYRPESTQKGADDRMSVASIVSTAETDKSASLASSEKDTAGQNVRPLAITLLKLTVTYAQTLAALSAYTRPSNVRVNSPDDPQIVPAFLQNFRFSTDLGMSFQQVKCALPSGFYEKHWGILLLPFIASIGLPLLIFAYAILRGLMAHAYSRAPGKCINKFFNKFPTLNRASANRFAMNAATIATFFVLPTGISTAAKLQNCEARFTGYFLIDDPEVSCASPRFMKLQLVARVIGFIYLVVPVVAGAALFYKSEVAKKVLLFLTIGYNTERKSRWPWAWECLVMFRKAVFTGVATGFLVLQDKRSQIVASVFLLCASLAVHLRVRPYERRNLNVLEAFALLGELAFSFSIMLRLATSIVPSVLTSVSREQFAKESVPGTELFVFDTITIIFNIPFLLVAGYWILHELSLGLLGHVERKVTAAVTQGVNRAFPNRKPAIKKAKVILPEDPASLRLLEKFLISANAIDHDHHVIPEALSRAWKAMEVKANSNMFHARAVVTQSRLFSAEHMALVNGGQMSHPLFDQVSGTMHTPTTITPYTARPVYTRKVTKMKLDGDLEGVNQPGDGLDSALDQFGPRPSQRQSFSATDHGEKSNPLMAGLGLERPVHKLFGRSFKVKQEGSNDSSAADAFFAGLESPFHAVGHGSNGNEKANPLAAMTLKGYRKKAIVKKPVGIFVDTSSYIDPPEDDKDNTPEDDKDNTPEDDKDNPPGRDEPIPELPLPSGGASVTVETEHSSTQQPANPEPSSPGTEENFLECTGIARDAEITPAPVPAAREPRRSVALSTQSVVLGSEYGTTSDFPEMGRRSAAAVFAAAQPANHSAMKRLSSAYLALPQQSRARGRPKVLVDNVGRLLVAEPDASTAATATSNPLMGDVAAAPLPNTCSVSPARPEIPSALSLGQARRTASSRRGDAVAAERPRLRPEENTVVSFLSLYGDA
jgi:hypothetical protein